MPGGDAHPGRHGAPPRGTTPPAIRQRLIEGYRRISPAEKIERVAALNRAAVQLATARIREQCGPDPSPRELRLPLRGADAAALREP